MKPVTEMGFDEIIGRTAYNGYCGASDGKSLISGAKLPLWSELKSEIQNAWIAAAFAVVGMRDK